LAIAKQLYPDLTPQLISISGHSVCLTFPGEWHPNGRSVLKFDAITGALVSHSDVRNSSQGYLLSQMIYLLHVAAVGGIAWLVVVLVGGVALILLPITGIYFWCWRHYQLYL